MSPERRLPPVMTSLSMNGEVLTSPGPAANSRVKRLETQRKALRPNEASKPRRLRQDAPANNSRPDPELDLCKNCGDSMESAVLVIEDDPIVAACIQREVRALARPSHAAQGHAARDVRTHE